MSRWVSRSIHLRRLLPTLDEAASEGTHVDLQDLLRRLTFGNICGEDGVGGGLPRVPPRAVAVRRGHPLRRAARLVPVRGVQRRGEDLPRQGPGVPADEEHLAVARGQRVEQKMSLTLFMKHGLRMEVQRNRATWPPSSMNSVARARQQGRARRPARTRSVPSVRQDPCCGGDSGNSIL
ncbi:hypothetical protein SORBI_3003G390000 [Sorghum bicolor]|uniref:Uncharacterized protein n=1 Tax=Sorghum bicolor TaxID=4558 RepID=A0A1W0W125_SORBI|nr:hypothetical protein SORBI_3003G390000 [Sorghum bicolor]